MYEQHRVFQTLRSLELTAANAPFDLRDRILEFVEKIREEVFLLDWKVNNHGILVTNYMGYVCTIGKLVSGSFLGYAIKEDTDCPAKVFLADNLHKVEKQIIDFIDNIKELNNG